MRNCGKNALLMRCLNGEELERIPFWFMRQAGRYLPEYLKTRKEAGSFLDLCFNVDKATEVTMQPIRRYDMDAAILFSDILVIPHALGQKLWFESGEGPKLEALNKPEDLENLTLEKAIGNLSKIFKIIQNIRKNLDDRKALIGFAGGPWTVATYMVEGGSSKNYLKTKQWALRDPKGFQILIDILIKITSDYLIEQANAGVNAIQIFDSWAGALDETSQYRYCFKPMRAIASRVKAEHPDIKIIVFAKGVGANLEAYAKEPLFDALSLDHTVNLSWAKERLGKNTALQGNLDPMAVVAGGDVMIKEAERICSSLGPKGLIFNLSHGFIPQTPPQHVAKLAEFLRNRKN